MPMRSPQSRQCARRQRRPGRCAAGCNEAIRLVPKEAFYSWPYALSPQWMRRMLESKGRARDRALLAKSRAAKATIKDSDGSRENGCAGEASDVSGVAENKLTKKLHTPPNCPISMPAFRKTLSELDHKIAVNLLRGIRTRQNIRRSPRVILTFSLS